MGLIRLVASHLIVIQKMEEAARTDNWEMFRYYMRTIDVHCHEIYDPFAMVCKMKADTDLKNPAFMIIVPVAGSGIPWIANLSSWSSYKRVGMHSITWCFDKDIHRRMRKEGFDVDSIS